MASRLTGRPALRISLYYTAMFGMVGVTMPFYPAWLMSRGLDAAEIGLLLSCSMWVRVISNPVATSMADRLGERRRVMTCLAGAGLMTALLLPLAHGFWPLLLVAVGHTMVWAPVMPLGDNLALLTARERRLDYGRLRLWGSASFIATSVGAGLILKDRSQDLIIVLILTLLALTFVSTLFLPDIPKRPAVPAKAAPVRALLTSPTFLLFVAAAALNSASHSVLSAFATIHWRAAGLSDDLVGVLWSAGVAAEIALFALGGRIAARIGALGLFGIAAFAGIVRWIGTAATTDFAALLALQTLHAFTFGAAHLGAMTFIGRAIPQHYSATAQGLYSSLSMGLVVGLTMMGSGALYAAFGGRAFLFMAALSLASLGATLALARIWREAEPAPASVLPDHSGEKVLHT